MTGEALKPCPFCGTKAELFHGRPGCPDKECPAYQFYEDDAAISPQIWNRRADPGDSRPAAEERLGQATPPVPGVREPGSATLSLANMLKEMEREYRMSVDDPGHPGRLSLCPQSTVKEWAEVVRAHIKEDEARDARLKELETRLAEDVERQKRYGSYPDGQLT